MTDAGGFCEKHGPFDPPHQTCPYCALEEKQRLAYGPPAAESPTHVSPAAGLARDADLPPNVTEPIPADRMDATPQPAPDVAARPPLGWLVVKEPLARRGAILGVRSNQIIGREGDVRWDDPRLSRQHARLTFEPPDDAPDGPPEFHLWPFGPTNPVFINGRQIRGATPLHENDEVRLGDTLFVFKVLMD